MTPTAAVVDHELATPENHLLPHARLVGLAGFRREREGSDDTHADGSERKHGQASEPDRSSRAHTTLLCLWN